MLRLSLVIFWAYSFSCASEIPNDVQNLLNKRHKAVESIDSKLIKELEKLKVAYTKRGDLKSANTIVGLIEEYNTAQKLSDKTVLYNKLVNSSWKWWKNERITLLSNNTALWSYNGRNTFTWKIVDVDKRIIEGITSNGKIYRITFNERFTAGGIKEGETERQTVRFTGE